MDLDKYSDYIREWCQKIDESLQAGQESLKNTQSSQSETIEIINTIFNGLKEKAHFESTSLTELRDKLKYVSKDYERDRDIALESKAREKDAKNNLQGRVNYLRESLDKLIKENEDLEKQLSDFKDGPKSNSNKTNNL